ncbi:MAG: hypothetical protein AAF682_03575 [Planctomycetota bacterium]
MHRLVLVLALAFGLGAVPAGQEEGERLAVRDELADGGWIEREVLPGDEDGPTAGAYTRFDAAGERRIDGELRGGRPEGRWRFWDDAGTLRIQGKYREGERTGEWSFFDADGEPRARGKFRDGKPRGRWVFSHPAGDELTVELEHVERSNVHGRRVYEGLVADGAPHGPWRFYWPNGRLQLAASFDRGARTGKWRFFHADGSADPTSGFFDLDHGAPDPFVGLFTDPPPAAEWGGPELDVAPWTIRGPARREGLPGVEVGLSSRPAVELAGRLRSATDSERPDLLSELVALDRAAVPAAIQGLLALDLSTEAGASLGGLLARRVLTPITGQDYGWEQGVGPEARSTNRLASLRWLAFDALTRDSEGYWRLERKFARAASADGPDFVPLFLDREWLVAREEALERSAPPRLAPRFAARRDLRKLGGKGTAEAVQRGLGWLSAHQSPDGAWRDEQFADTLHEVGLTGLALLAFLADGHTPTRGEHRETVARGLAWLVGRQHPERGFEGPKRLYNFIYDHTIATVAVAEASAVCDSPRLRASLRDAVRLVERARNPYGGWRYNVPPVGDNDTSVTAWALQALVAARDAGARVDREAFVGGLNWIGEVTDPSNGRVGYDSFGSPSSRLPDNSHFPREKGEAMTAAGLFCRLTLGQTPETDPIVTRHAELLLRQLPRWDKDELSCDMYYWYFGTLAMHQMGDDFWEAWNERMRPLALSKQRDEGKEAGSWDPVGPWGSAVGGRVYSTALMTLILEVYYRYERVLERR